MIQHGHAKTKMPALRQCFTNPAHADNTQGFAMHIVAKMLGADVALPLPGTNHIGQLDHPPCGGKDQCKTGVGRGFGQYVGGVAQENAAPVKVVQVIVVDANRDARHRLKVRRQIQQWRIQFETGPEQTMGVGQGGTQSRQTIAVRFVDQRDICMLLQAAHQRRRQFFIQNDVFFHRIHLG